MGRAIWRFVMLLIVTAMHAKKGLGKKRKNNRKKVQR